MVNVPVTIASLIQQGRAEALDPDIPRIYLSFNADFTAAANITVNLGSIPQVQRFGIVRSIFIDNGSNPTAVNVSVTGSNQTFTAPAQTQGFYTINAPDKAAITLVTAGGASMKSTITLYNYDVAPNVWYSNGAIVTGSVAAYGPDAVGVVPTHPPLYMGVIDSAGHIIGLQLTAGGDLPVIAKQNGVWNIGTIAGPIALPTGAATEATSLDIVSAVDDVATILTNQGTGLAYTDRSNAALTGATQNLMLGNANRRILIIDNIGATAIGVNLTGAAATLGAGSLVIAAGGTIVIDKNVPTSTITIIGTAAAAVTAYEG